MWRCIPRVLRESLCVKKMIKLPTVWKKVAFARVINTTALKVSCMQTISVTWKEHWSSSIIKRSHYHIICPVSRVAHHEDPYKATSTKFQFMSFCSLASKRFDQQLLFTSWRQEVGNVFNASLQTLFQVGRFRTNGFKVLQRAGKRWREMKLK